jgi:hypothetical protein
MSKKEKDFDIYKFQDIWKIKYAEFIEYNKVNEITYSKLLINAEENNYNSLYILYHIYISPKSVIKKFDDIEYVKLGEVVRYNFFNANISKGIYSISLIYDKIDYSSGSQKFLDFGDEKVYKVVDYNDCYMKVPKLFILIKNNKFEESKFKDNLEEDNHNDDYGKILEVDFKDSIGNQIMLKQVILMGIDELHDEWLKKYNTVEKDIPEKFRKAEKENIYNIKKFYNSLTNPLNEYLPVPDYLNFFTDYEPNYLMQEYDTLVTSISYIYGKKKKNTGTDEKYKGYIKLSNGFMKLPLILSSIYKKDLTNVTFDNNYKTNRNSRDFFYTDIKTYKPQFFSDLNDHPLIKLYFNEVNKFLQEKLIDAKTVKNRFKNNIEAPSKFSSKKSSKLCMFLLKLINQSFFDNPRSINGINSETFEVFRKQGNDDMKKYIAAFGINNFYTTYKNATPVQLDSNKFYKIPKIFYLMYKNKNNPLSKEDNNNIKLLGNYYFEDDPTPEIPQLQISKMDNIDDNKVTNYINNNSSISKLLSLNNNIPKPEILGKPTTTNTQKVSNTSTTAKPTMTKSTTTKSTTTKPTMTNTPTTAKSTTTMTNTQTNTQTVSNVSMTPSRISTTSGSSNTGQSKNIYYIDKDHYDDDTTFDTLFIKQKDKFMTTQSVYFTKDPNKKFLILEFIFQDDKRENFELLRYACFSKIDDRQYKFEEGIINQETFRKNKNEKYFQKRTQYYTKNIYYIEKQDHYDSNTTFDTLFTLEKKNFITTQRMYFTKDPEKKFLIFEFIFKDDTRESFELLPGACFSKIDDRQYYFKKGIIEPATPAATPIEAMTLPGNSAAQSRNSAAQSRSSAAQSRSSAAQSPEIGVYYIDNNKHPSVEPSTYLKSYQKLGDKNIPYTTKCELYFTNNKNESILSHIKFIFNGCTSDYIYLLKGTNLKKSNGQMIASSPNESTIFFDDDYSKVISINPATPAVTPTGSSATPIEAMTPTGNPAIPPPIPQSRNSAVPATPAAEHFEWYPYYYNGIKSLGIESCKIIEIPIGITLVKETENDKKDVFYVKQNSENNFIDLYNVLFLVLGKNKSGGYDIYQL